MAKYENRFPGKDNAGLRKLIREAAPSHRCGTSNARSVIAVGSKVALTYQGMATLVLVAADFYDWSKYAPKPGCDCDACTAKEG